MGYLADARRIAAAGEQWWWEQQNPISRQSQSTFGEPIMSPEERERQIEIARFWSEETRRQDAERRQKLEAERAKKKKEQDILWAQFVNNDPRTIEHNRLTAFRNNTLFRDPGNEAWSCPKCRLRVIRWLPGYPVPTLDSDSALDAIKQHKCDAMRLR